jgi:hypothetical protein
MPAMRHNCALQGCFNVKLRPKIEVFDDCFGGSNAFGDVDGLVERNGAFCLLEWKSTLGRLTLGQAAAYFAFSRLPGCACFVAVGDAETMVVNEYTLFWREKYQRVFPATLPELKDRVSGWHSFVDRSLQRPRYDLTGLTDSRLPLI